MFLASRGGAFFVTFYSRHVKLKATKHSQSFGCYCLAQSILFTWTESVCNQSCVAKIFGCASAMHEILDESTIRSMGISAAATHVCYHWLRAGIVNTSHKRKCVLYCNVVNDINPAYLHTDYEPEPRQEVAVLPSGVNADTTDAEDEDKFDENANGWED